jgi:hypothetical protein
MVLGQTDISRWKYKYMFTATLQGCAFCPKACQHCTDKKENQIFLIYKEIQHKVIYEDGLLIYEEMRKYLLIYEEAIVIYDLATAPFIHSFIHSFI